MHDASSVVQGRWTDASRRKPASAGRHSGRPLFSLGKPATTPPKVRAPGLGARLLSNLRSGLPQRRNSTGSSGRGTPDVPQPAGGGAAAGGESVTYVIDLESGWPHASQELPSPSARKVRLQMLWHSGHI